jgi:hypothetical protein
MRELFVMACLAVAGCSAARAEEAKKPKVDPKADELLHKMSNSLAGATTLQFDADHELEVVTKEGQVLQFVAQSRVGAQRPNKARSDRVGPVASGTFYYDGNQIAVYDKRANLYATASAPGKLDAAIDFARDKLNLEAPAADLLYSDPYNTMMEDVVSGSYVGLEPVGNRMCHHLAYRGNVTDWQIWVEDSPQALPCRYVILSKDVKGQPRFEVSFSNFQLNPSLAPLYFVFTPPNNATRIDFFNLRQEERKGHEQAKR